MTGFEVAMENDMENAGTLVNKLIVMSSGYKDYKKDTLINGDEEFKERSQIDHI